MLSRGDILDRYRRLRTLCVEHHGAAIVEQAKRLGLADGRVLLTDSHDELSLIFDLALYQRRPGRSRAIDRYAKGARALSNRISVGTPPNRRNAPSMPSNQSVCRSRIEARMCIRRE